MFVWVSKWSGRAALGWTRQHQCASTRNREIVDVRPVGVVFGLVEVWDVRVGVLESKPGGLVFVGAFLEEGVVLM